MKPIWTLLFTLLLALEVSGQNASFTDQARFIAGIPVTSGPLEPLTHESAWTTYSAEFQQAWTKLEERQLNPAREWSGRYISEAANSRDPAFYMFSGPDLLYVQTFLPKASTYIMCGIEPIGVIPDVLKLPPHSLPAALAGLRKSLNSVLDWSFFITKDMKSDLQQNPLTGTLPILCLFLARSQAEIDGIEMVGLDKSGELVSGKSSIPGVKISFRSINGQQTVYYFATDISNGGIGSNPGFINFCKKQGQGNSFLKAASYLPHQNEFSRIRDFILANSRQVIEDDAGIPVHFFNPDVWTLRVFGRYKGPIDLFKQYPQPDLMNIYAKSNPAPLPFGFGYRWHGSDSSLILAVRK